MTRSFQLRLAIWVSSFVVPALGCSTKALTLGDGPVVAEDASVPSTPDGGVAGTWTGYLEAYELPSGSGAVTFALTNLDDGGLTGTAQFGALPPLAPPTDPDVGYPPSELKNTDTRLPATTEQFVFTVRNVVWDGSRLTFALYESEVWAAWCALQTTTYAPTCSCDALGGGTYGYGCVPLGSDGFGEPDGSNGAVCEVNLPDSGLPLDLNCGKATICLSGVCTCDATRCWGTPSDGAGGFSLRLAGGGGDDAGRRCGVE
ncbi:MAG TPA: hypothetical protein VGI39_19900 [Polyangiaceae bacterium]|jgi:hypothetical protein